MQGTILSGVGSFYETLAEDGNVYTLRPQGKIRHERLKPKVGDKVELLPGTGEEHGWIQSILPRRNTLVRPPVSNIDVIVIVIASATPDPDLMLVDRMLVNTRRAGIQPMLVITKSELDPEMVEEILQQYAEADVDPIAVSSVKNEGIEELRMRLKGKICALAGQSGAGKSTLINALYGLSLETGTLSRKIERGKNTTRHCSLIPVEDGGMILDTPGFSLLENDLFDPIELKECWPEFRECEGGCYFQPCYHAYEPRCAAQGHIHEQRHERYKQLLDETKQRWRERYD